MAVGEDDYIARALGFHTTLSVEEVCSVYISNFPNQVVSTRGDIRCTLPVRTTICPNPVVGVARLNFGRFESLVVAVSPCGERCVRCDKRACASVSLHRCAVIYSHSLASSTISRSATAGKLSLNSSVKVSMARFLGESNT